MTWKLNKHSLTVRTFEMVEEADRAKEALNGADIYSGCCTLKVEWGKVCSLTLLVCALVRKKSRALIYRLA